MYEDRAVRFWWSVQRSLAHCRYQYLELASFLTHGLCVNATDPGEHGYYLSHKGYESWHDFYTKSSDALNIQSALLNTRCEDHFLLVGTPCLNNKQCSRNIPIADAGGPPGSRCMDRP